MMYMKSPNSMLKKLMSFTEAPIFPRMSYKSDQVLISLITLSSLIARIAYKKPTELPSYSGSIVFSITKSTTEIVTTTASKQLKLSLM